MPYHKPQAFIPCGKELFPSLIGNLYFQSGLTSPLFSTNMLKN